MTEEDLDANRFPHAHPEDGAGHGNFAEKLPMRKMEKYPLWVRVLAVIAAGAGLAVLFVFKPEDHPYPRCLFHDLTGLYCPGCGSTRAFYQLLHGHLLAALHFNALAMLAIPFILWAWYRQKPLSQIHPAWVWAIFYLVLSFTILRNIPLSPFTYLAPG